MSLDAMTWAFEQPVDSAAERLVLLALANHVKKGQCTAWPGRQRLRNLTKLDPKTITAAMRALGYRGVIKDTGERVGRTGRVPVYALAMPSNGTKSGTIETGEISTLSGEAIAPDFLANGAVSPLLNSTENGGQNQEVNESGLNQAPAGAQSDNEFIWSSGLKLLTETGEEEKSARSFLGDLRKMFGDAEAAKLVRQASDKSRPKTWLAGCMRNGPRGRAADVGLRGKDYGAGIPQGAAA